MITTKTLLIYALAAMALRSAETQPKPPAPANVAAIASNGARQIQYGEHEIISIAAKIRFTTLIRLPKGEQILDFICGDKDNWQVTGVQNFAFIKPAKSGTSTSLHLVTAAGTVYAFVLTEVGDTGAAPDLELDVSTKDASLLSAIGGDAKFVPASAVADFQAQYEIAKQNERIAKEQADLRVREADAKVEAARAQAHEDYPAVLKFTYRFEKNKAPFLVSAIYHDEKFTYIQANPQETPAVYEMKDGKPSLIQFDFKDGVYTIPKIMTDGYLAIGKKRLPFEQEPVR
jgi:type IV secretion system protein VirB9